MVPQTVGGQPFAQSRDGAGAFVDVVRGDLGRDVFSNPCGSRTRPIRCRTGNPGGGSAESRLSEASLELAAGIEPATF